MLHVYGRESISQAIQNDSLHYTQSKGDQAAQGNFQLSFLKYIGTDGDRNPRDLLRHSEQVIAEWRQ